MPKNYAGYNTDKHCTVAGCDGPYYGKGLCHTHYFRARRTGSPLTKVDPSRQLLGKAAERAVAELLRLYGRTVELAAHDKSDFDLLADGHRVDVKCSMLHTDKYGPHWFISISHWGKLDESGKDFYIFRLEQVPHMKEPVHLLFRVPIHKPSLRITMKHLLERYASAIADFYAFARGEFDRKEKVA